MVAGIRRLATRVHRLEQARTPVMSPCALAFGSFDAFTTWADEGIAAGILDPRDFPVIVHCLRRYERDGTWGQEPPKGMTQRP